MDEFLEFVVNFVVICVFRAKRKVIKTRHPVMRALVRRQRRTTRVKTSPKPRQRTRQLVTKALN